MVAANGTNDVQEVRTHKGFATRESKFPHPKVVNADPDYSLNLCSIHHGLL